MLQTISWVTKLDSQLYPVITTNAVNPKDVASHIEQKLETVLPEIKRAQCEVEQRIKTTEALMAKSPPIDERSLNVKNKLIEMNEKLIEITGEYQVLLEQMVSHFREVHELDNAVDNLNNQFDKVGLPTNLSELDAVIREHETSKQTAIELFKFIQSEQLVNRIYKQVSGFVAVVASRTCVVSV